MPDFTSSGELFTFPDGLPSFEDDRVFRLSRREGLDPLLFLDSVREGGPGFVCVPVQVLDPGYFLRLDQAAAVLLGIAEGEYSAPESPYLAVALLTFPPADTPTANLLAPVVFNPEARLGAQIIQFDSDYSVVHPLREAAPCS
jgi:flagellar assembly factor FliW